MNILFFIQQKYSFFDYNNVIDYIVLKMFSKSGAGGGKFYHRRIDGKDFSLLLEENFGQRRCKGCGAGNSCRCHARVAKWKKD